MQVSHSRIETFKKCPFQFKLKYIDKLETYFNNDPANPLIIGTALHTGIEKDTETAIREYFANYAVISDQNIDEAIKLEAVIEKCRAVLPVGMHEVKIESREFLGFIDLLVPVKVDYSTIEEVDDACCDCYKRDDCYEVNSGHVCSHMRKIEWFDMYDFKYSNNVKNYLESGQLHEYKYYFERLNPGKRIRKMYFLFAPKVAIRMKYKNKTNPRDETIEEFRKRLKAELDGKDAQLIEVPYDIEKVKDFLRNAKDCRMATQFPKNPTRLCDWCDYKKYCEEGETLEIMNLPKNERRTIEANTKKKIWLYGAPFSGKTYLANRFPDPLMLNTDGNVKFVDAPYIAIKDEVKVEGRITKRTFAWQVFKDAIEELEKKQNDFKTIVVDLLEDTYEACRLFMYDQLGISHESDDSFRAWDKVRTEFLSTIKRLMNLDYENIILISHEDTSKDLTKKTGDKVTAIKPNINDKAALKIAGMVDLVARVIDDEGARTLSFKNNEVIFGGGRLTLNVNEIPCDYDELCHVYDEANKGSVATAPREKRPALNNPVAETVDKVKEVADPLMDKLKEVVETATAAPAPTERKRKARTPDPEPEVVPPPTDKDAPPFDVEETATAPAEEAPRRRRRRTAE